MSEFLPLLAAAFAAGLLGSAHCLGMCSGISGLFAIGATVASFRAQVPLAIAYNVGEAVHPSAVPGGLRPGHAVLRLPRLR